MDDLKKRLASYILQRDSAIKRSIAAEDSNRRHEALLVEKDKQLLMLHERLDLIRRLVQVTKDLSRVREKTRQSEEKLQALNLKVDGASVKEEGMRKECEDYELKYDDMRRKMKGLEEEIAVAEQSI